MNIKPHIKTLVIGMTVLAMGVLVLAFNHSTASAATVEKAQGKPTTASSIEGAGLESYRANDGSTTTRWSSTYTNNQWWQVDLGSATLVSKLDITWETAYASRYYIQGSTDGITFTTLADVTNSSAGLKSTSFTETNVRYVRVYGVTRATAWGFSIFEVKVYGSDIVPNAQVEKAQGKLAKASSVEGAGLEAGKANDGNTASRWGSAYANNQWWQVDLGSATLVSKLGITWETAYASRYYIQGSTDGVNFTTLADVTATAAGLKSSSFTETSIRYVRVYGVTRATAWGFSIFEVKVYGPAATPVTVKPAAPTGLKATAGNSQVSLSWNANSDTDKVDAYQVYRNDLLVKDGLTTLSYTDTGLTNGTTYTYRVSAHNAAGFGPWNDPAIAVVPVVSTPPSAPVSAVISDSAASGGSALKLYTNATANKTTTTPDVNKLTITAKGDQCNGAPTMVVKLDGVQIASTAVSATGYTAYDTAISKAAGSHVVAISFINDFTNSTCSQALILDKVEFTPTPAAAPTVSLTASPTSINSGSSSTLTWSSTNASSCTASNGWTGTKATSGTETVAPTATSAYTLACTGAGGSASASAQLTVSSSPTSNNKSVTHLWVNADTSSMFNFSADSPKTDVFIAHASTSWPWADSYHAVNPKGRAFFYVNFGVAGDNTCCVASVLDASVVTANGWWATHNGAKIPNPWGGPSWIVDLGKPGVAEAYIAALKTHWGNHNWQGVFADDVNSWRNLGYNIDGYSSSADWVNRAVLPLVQKVTSGIATDKHGVVIPNIGNWPGEPDLDVFSDAASGGLNEWYLTWNDGLKQNVTEIENEYNSMRKVIAKGHEYYGITHSTTLTKYTFCAAAIMGEPGKVFITNQTAYGSAALTWDPVFELDLGVPVGATQHTTGSSKWSRQYTSSTLSIDTATQTCTIQ